MTHGCTVPVRGLPKKRGRPLGTLPARSESRWHRDASGKRVIDQRTAGVYGMPFRGLPGVRIGGLCCSELQGKVCQFPNERFNQGANLGVKS